MRGFIASIFSLLVALLVVIVNVDYLLLASLSKHVCSGASHSLARVQTSVMQALWIVCVGHLTTKLLLLHRSSSVMHYLVLVSMVLSC